VLTKILVGPDETVPVGTPLGEIEVGATGSAGSGSAPAGGEQDSSVSDEGGATQSEAAATEALHMPEPGGSVEKPVSDEEHSRDRGPSLPEMGESVTEGTVLEWLKQVGDPVELEEGIVEVSTDKVDTEVPSPAAGTLAEILVAAGRDGAGRHSALPDRSGRRRCAGGRAEPGGGQRLRRSRGGP